MKEPATYEDIQVPKSESHPAEGLSGPEEEDERTGEELVSFQTPSAQAARSGSRLSFRGRKTEMGIAAGADGFWRRFFSSLASRLGPRGPTRRSATWLILPVVICLSQRLSHACVSINTFVL